MPRQILPKSSWIAPDFVPETFGRLTTTSSRYKPEDSKCVVQDFVCECGKQVTLWPYNVTRGGTQSCGCLRRERYAEWAEILGVGAPMLYQRLNAGWPVEDAFRTPAGEAHRLSHVYRRRVESRKSKHYTYNGLTMTLYEWALHLGIAKVTLKARLAKGWPISRVLGEPVKKKKSSH